MDFSKLSLGLVGVACAMALEVPVLQGGTAPSGPVAIGPGAFSGNETVIDFESIAQNEQITTQFAALGVTFSGDLFGDTFNTELFENTDAGVVIACNFIDNTCNTPVGCSGSWTVDFSSPVTRLGFDTITNNTDDTTLTIFRSNVQIGSITFDTSVPDSFVGIEDSDGIDRVIVDAANNFNGAICINNFRFEGPAGPEDCSGFPCGNNDNKVLLCHVPPGNPANAHTICISPNAVAAHLENHPGDQCGPCGDGSARLQAMAPTPLPVSAVPTQPCPTDIDLNGVTNVLDLIDLLLCFGQPAFPGCEAKDVNQDGTVNVLDLIDLLLAFGTTCQ